MPVSFTCPCSKKLRIPDELAGKKVRCPGCGTTLRVPAQEVVESPAAPAATPRAKPPAFPVLGFCIGGGAVLVGCLLIAGGVVVTANINSWGGEFKPAALIVFGLPGLLWVLF